MSNKQLVRALKISSINISDIVIGTKKINRKVSITYQGKPLVFQTPYLKVSGKPTKTANQNFMEINTLFEGDSREKIDEWFNFIDNLENSISVQIEKHIEEWFSNTNITIKSLIRGTDILYIKWIVGCNHGFIDDNNKYFDPQNLKEGNLIRMVVSAENLWINENQCGLYIIVPKLMVKTKEEQNETEYDFNSESDDELISVLATEQKPEQIKKTAKLNVKKPELNRNLTINQKKIPNSNSLSLKIDSDDSDSILDDFA
jgi:hypothetical protein